MSSDSGVIIRHSSIIHHEIYLILRCHEDNLAIQRSFHPSSEMFFFARQVISSQLFISISKHAKPAEDFHVNRI